MNNESKDLVTIKELCKILSIGRNTAYKLLNENKIKAFRIGKVWKISKMAVEEFILSQSQINFPIPSYMEQSQDGLKKNDL